MSGQHTTPALRSLQARPQWVCWRKEQREGRLTKVPYDPRTGKLARSNDPATWARYELAQQAYEWSQRKGQRSYDGIGYMFHRDITGIDLDHCIAPDGTIDAWARAYLDRLRSYSERSPSDEGIHVLVHGTVPKGIRRGIAGQRHADAAIEMYCEGRYFTVTGKHLVGMPTTIEACQDALDALYAEIAAVNVTDVTKIPAAPAGPTGSQDDELLLKKAMAASNGDKFRALFYHGSTSRYPSASEADMALCMMLAFWTGKDVERMDRLYRRSALYREKWDSTRSESTYGWDTLHQAAARCRVVYDPQHTKGQLERDVEQLLKQIAQQQASLSRQKKRKPYQIVPKEVPLSKVLEYLEMNEHGDGLFFAEVFAGQVCYDHSTNKWYLWNGHHWKQDETGKVRLLVAGVLSSLYLKAYAELNTAYAEVVLKLQAAQSQASKEPGDVDALSKQQKELASRMSELQARAKGLRGAKRMQNVLTAFIQPNMGVTSAVWDTDPWLLAVPNGVIDLRTGACRDGVPDDYIRTVAPTEWTGIDTPCPRFERFLQEIFEDKPDRDSIIDFLQRLLGYGMSGITTTHIFPILYGPQGRNGKDTLLSILRAILGSQVGAVSNDVFLVRDGKRAAGAATPHLVDLQGKRLAWGSEPKDGDRLDIAQIKLLSGEGDVSARQIMGHQYNFTPTHKLLLMTNYRPHASADDESFWARTCLIEFGIRFLTDPQAPNERKADLSLKAALLQEQSGILAWLVRGCLAWQQLGLEIPASIRVATGQYRQEEDALLLFLQECCVLKPEATVQGKPFYEAYRKWHEENQVGRRINSIDFGKKMKKRFQGGESNGRVIYRGVGLLAREDDPQAQSLFEDQSHPKQASRGSVEGDKTTLHTHQAASEGIPEDPSRECRGSDPTLEYSVKKELYSDNRVLPSTPSTPASVNIPQSASQAEGREGEGQEQPSTDPLLTREIHTCTTRYEKQLQGSHQAIATHFSAGCWWCEKCEPQRTWMEFGEANTYPQIDVPEHTFKVPSGRESWLRFAQEAGYTFVQYALEAARQPESFEL